MKLVDSTVVEFLNKVDSKTPTPGGGSIAALSLSEGISLIRMVAHLSITKKKYLSLEEDAKLDYQKRVEELEEFKAAALNLVDEDALSFDNIMDAYALPKETSEEIDKRDEAINKATIHATKVPFNTAEVACHALEVAAPMFKYAAKSATSDFGVGVVMIKAAFTSAKLNVLTNMQAYKDEEIKEDFISRIDSLSLIVDEISDKLMKEVFDKLR